MTLLNKEKNKKIKKILLELELKYFRFFEELQQ